MRLSRRLARLACCCVVSALLVLASPAAVLSQAAADGMEDASAAPTASGLDGTLGVGDAQVSLVSVTLRTSAAAADANRVALAASSAVNWIDRVDFSGNAYGREFYDILVEASDHDGVSDYLIEDRYATGSFPAMTEVRVGEMFTSGAYNGILVAAEPFTAAEGFSAAATRTQSYLTAAAFAFDRDYPEVFWLSSSVGLLTATVMDSSGAGTIYRGYLVSDRTGAFAARIAGYTSQASIEAGIARCENAVQAIVQTADHSSASRTVAAFNQWLVSHNQYNTTSAARLLAQASLCADPWRSVSALEGRIGAAGPVCEGYARAFKVLCDSVGIPCVLVDGSARVTPTSVSELHMWNAVEVGGRWYAVDVTWNDPVGGSGAVSGAETDRWTLLGSASPVGTSAGWTFSASHPVSNTPAAGFSFPNGPALSSTAFGAGSPDATVPGTGRASTSYTVPAASAPQSTSRIDITEGTVSVASATYTGAALRPAVTVKVGGKTLRAGTDFTVSYANNKNPGTGIATITGKGSYMGTYLKHFAIAKPSLAKATVRLSATSYVYNGKVKTPKVTVLVGGTVLSSSAYTVSYAKGRKAVGSYTVTVKARSAYATGSATAKFTVVPAAVKLVAPKALSRGFRVTWKKGSAAVTGYQLQYATVKSFKGARTVKVSKRATVSTTVRKLKAKKKYYVRVRPFTKKGSSVFYGAWSATKTVTTKK